MIIHWRQHKLQVNRPAQVLLGRNFTQFNASTALIVISAEPVNAGTMLSAKHVRQSMRRGRPGYR